jgi:hypothetical protein
MLRSGVFADDPGFAGAGVLQDHFRTVCEGWRQAADLDEPTPQANRLRLLGPERSFGKEGTGDIRGDRIVKDCLDGHDRVTHHSRSSSRR